MSRPTVRAIALLAVAAAASLGLAGCLNNDFPTTSATPSSAVSSAAPPETQSPAATSTPTESATPTQAPTSTTSPSATPTVDPPTPIAVDCDAMLTPQALYAVNPNYSVGDPVTSAGKHPLATQALADGGTVCKVVSESGSASALISVSEPGASSLAADEAAAGSVYGSCPAADFCVNAPTSKVTIYGTDSSMQAFSGELRFTAEGTRFDPDALAALLTAAVAAIG